MRFDPRPDYKISNENISLEQFHFYPDAYISRPPYQRKTVWSISKKRALMDSLFRKYYVPAIVLREVVLNSDNNEKRTVEEVIDGQQRITTIQSFFNNEFTLPKELSSLSGELAGKHYKDLSTEIKQFLGRLSFRADKILNIDNPFDAQHQTIATEIFWRLQQGEPLRSMEIMHARLSSPIRNFIVARSDDISFDYEHYEPKNENKEKHKFFSIINRTNARMEHLGLMGRMLLLERAGGPTDLKDKNIMTLVDDSRVINGIRNRSFDDDKNARLVIENLNFLVQIFKDDPILKNGGKIKELSKEYFILSVYLLIRHQKKHYARIDTAIYREFILEFFQRWNLADSKDLEIQEFSNNRQQDSKAIRTRDLILRKAFLEFCQENKATLTPLDERRGFSELQRITIYRKNSGLCQMCVNEGKSEKDAHITWEEFEADHEIPYIDGGKTNLKNATLLCINHNRSKGASPKSA